MAVIFFVSKIQPALRALADYQNNKVTSHYLGEYYEPTYPFASSN